MGQRRRPLLRATQIQDLLARLDHAAVNGPGDNLRHLVRHDREVAAQASMPRLRLQGIVAPDSIERDGADGLEWTVPSPAPYHTFSTPPDVK